MKPSLASIKRKLGADTYEALLGDLRSSIDLLMHDNRGWGASQAADAFFYILHDYRISDFYRDPSLSVLTDADIEILLDKAKKGLTRY